MKLLSLLFVVANYAAISSAAQMAQTKQGIKRRAQELTEAAENRNEQRAQKKARYLKVFDAIQTKDFALLQSLFDQQHEHPDLNKPLVCKPGPNWNYECQTLKDISPFQYALRDWPDERVIVFLLNHGAEMNAPYYARYGTPLSLALKRAPRSIVELLIQRGALVERGKGYVADAINSGDVSKVQLLLDHGLSIADARTDNSICWPGVIRNPEMLTFVLSKGLVIPDKFILSLLETPSYRNQKEAQEAAHDNMELLSILLNRQPSLKNRVLVETTGGEPLFNVPPRITKSSSLLNWAIYYRNPEAVALLIQHYASPFQAFHNPERRRQQLDSFILAENRIRSIQEQLNIPFMTPIVVHLDMQPIDEERRRRDEALIKKTTAEHEKERARQRIALEKAIQIRDMLAAYRQHLAMVQQLHTDALQKILEGGLQHPEHIQTAEDKAAAAARAEHMGGVAKDLAPQVEEYFS